MECSSYLPLFGRFEWASQPFLAKKGCFGAQNAHFWKGTSLSGPLASGRHR